MDLLTQEFSELEDQVALDGRATHSSVQNWAMYGIGALLGRNDAVYIVSGR
jgi:hypothetical protein